MRALVVCATAAFLLAGCANNNVANTKPAASVAAPAVSATATASPTKAATVAPTQASATVAASAPPAATTVAAPTSAHAWYTSSASNAREYYCDDDPQWQQLAAANQTKFASVPALLRAYPGRTLHQPCKDGATS